MKMMMIKLFFIITLLPKHQQAGHIAHILFQYHTVLPGDQDLLQKFYIHRNVDHIWPSF